MEICSLSTMFRESSQEVTISHSKYLQVIKSIIVDTFVDTMATIIQFVNNNGKHNKSHKFGGSTVPYSECKIISEVTT